MRNNARDFFIVFAFVTGLSLAGFFVSEGLKSVGAGLRAFQIESVQALLNAEMSQFRAAPNYRPQGL